MSPIEFILASFLSVSSPEGIQDMTQGQLDEFHRIETACLADNVYYEARNQGTAGQLAVVAVTMNRVNDDRYPNTICGVVKQGPHRPSWKGTGEMIPVRNRCQFSWYCDGKSDVPLDKVTYDSIYTFVELIVLGEINVIDITDGATHYHADYVEPDWAKTKRKTIEIEDHIFYVWD
jgi:spore germination cell wall hydrolase CwlJ-like protein